MCVLTRGERFKDARIVHNQHGSQSMDEVHSATGISQSMIKDLEDDEKNRSVGYDKIRLLAVHYGVSTDYLLGISDIPSQDQNIRSIAEFTGLSQETIEKIVEAKNSMSNVELIPLNWLLSNGFFGFGGLLVDLYLMGSEMVELRNCRCKRDGLSKDERIELAKHVHSITEHIDLRKYRADTIFRKLLDQYCYCLEDSNSMEYRKILETMNHGNH